MQGKSRTSPDLPPDRGATTACCDAAVENARLRAELAQRTLELEQTQERFQHVIERNADAIIVVDAVGTIRFANTSAERLFRATREALHGTPFGFPMVAGETTELDLLDPQGARVVEMRVVETEWEGAPACIASLRDVTERKRTEESARELIREHAARTAAEAAAERFHFLAEASRLLSMPLDYAETLATLARLCAEHMADSAAVYVVDDNGTVRRCEVAHRDASLHAAAQALRDQPVTENGAHPVLEVLRTRRPLVVEGVDVDGLGAIIQDERPLELAQRPEVSSCAIVPLIARDRVLGAITLASTRPERRFSDDDVIVAQDLALRAAFAIDNARLYRAAQEANQGKSDLLAVISHDLRTPLNSIMGHVELLSMGLPDPLSPGCLERVERIRASGSHLVYLIDELLSFARLDGGHEKLRTAQVDAVRIVHEVADVVEPLAQAGGLEFQLDVPEEPVPLHTDGDRLRQVLLNLLGNAVKYTERGRVMIRLRTGPDGAVRFDVADTGVGIDPAHVEHIFEPFWQVDPTQRARSGGTGLGLSVVRRLTQMLGGRVSVESDVGRGSVFSVILPAR